MPDHRAGLGRGRVEWGEGGPVSPQFGDMYFSHRGPLAESRHAFLDGLGVPQVWRGRTRYTLAETGFGTGRNFLMTWQAWREAGRPCRLDYLSVEGFPLERADLARALTAFPELEPLARQLLAAWPVLAPGSHRLRFEDGRLCLTLLLGPVEPMLAGLTARVDGWYLDGFAPKKNPEMWDEPVLKHLARLSAPGARLATYSASSRVRRGLEAAGFAMEKRPGLHKSECSAGSFQGCPGPLLATDPWFQPPTLPASGPVAVIGGGIAGCALLRALADQGRDAFLLERHDSLAEEASGNPSGLVEPRLLAEESADARFHRLAFLDAARRYDALEAAGHAVWRPQRGTFAMATDEREAGRQERLAALDPLPGALELLTAAGASDRLGVPLPRGGLWYPGAGCLHPPTVCRALAQGLEVRPGQRVDRLEPGGAGWRLLDAEGGTVAEAASVVVAAGAQARLLLPAGLGLFANRGQITLLPERGEGPRGALTFGGYLTPAFTDAAGGRRHVLGSTFARWPDPADDGYGALSAADHAHTLSGVQAALPDLAARWPEAGAEGRAALRCTTEDHLPLCGPVPDLDAFRRDYGDLHHGRHWKSYPPASWMPGLFVLSGLGSRGFQTGPLAAEILAAQLCGAPPPVDAEILLALNPARFLVRGLKKGRRGSPGLTRRSPCQGA